MVEEDEESRAEGLVSGWSRGFLVFLVSVLCFLVYLIRYLDAYTHTHTYIYLYARVCLAIQATHNNNMGGKKGGKHLQAHELPSVTGTASLDIPNRDDSEELHKEMQLVQANALVPVQGSGGEGGDEEEQGRVEELDAGVPRPHGLAVRVHARLDLLHEVHGDPLDARLDAHQPCGQRRRGREE